MSEEDKKFWEAFGPIDPEKLERHIKRYGTEGTEPFLPPKKEKVPNDQK